MVQAFQKQNQLSVPSGDIMDRKQIGVTLFEAIKKIYESEPHNLPMIIVHGNAYWSDPAMADSKGRLHMCEADFLYMKSQGAPTKLVREIDKTKSEHVFDIGQFATGLDPDAAKKRQVDKVKDIWGPDKLPDDAGELH